MKIIEQLQAHPFELDKKYNMIFFRGWNLSYGERTCEGMKLWNSACLFAYLYGVYYAEKLYA